MQIDRAAPTKTWDEILEADALGSEDDPLFSPCASNFSLASSSTAPPQFQARCRKTHDDEVKRVGTGVEGRNCGRRIKHKCLNKACGYVWWTDHECGERQCPKCYTKWAAHEAAQVRGIVEALHPNGNLVHAVVSLPGRPEDAFKLREKAYEIFKRQGVIGGAIIAHPWREGKDGNWEWDGYIHYHAIGELAPTGFITQPDYLAMHPRASPDYVFKVIPQHGGSTWYIEATWELFYRTKEGKPKGIAYYDLNHCAMSAKHHSISWFGSWWSTLAWYGSLKENWRDTILLGAHEEESCPMCGSLNIEIVDETSQRNERILKAYRDRFKSMSARERQYSRMGRKYIG